MQSHHPSHRLRPEIFRILFALAWLSPSAAWRYWPFNDTFCSNAAATVAAKIANTFAYPNNSQNAPSSSGIWTPIRHLVSWAHSSLHPKRHVDRFSRFFAPRTVDCPITLEWAATFPQNFPFRGGSGLLFNTWYLGPPDALTQAASRLIQLFLYGSQMLWCTMHCQWDRKLQHFPFLWDFITLLLSEEERSTAISNEHKKLVNIARVVWKICSRTNRQTHTDALITILCHRSRGRSN